MNDGLVAVLAAVATVGVASGVYWMNTKGQARRKAALRAFAARHGIAYVGDPGDQDFLPATHQAGYPKLGGNREVHSLMTVERPGYALQTFNIRVSTRTNDPGDRVTWSEWLMPFVVQFRTIEIPDFQIRIRMPINPAGASKQSPVELAHDRAFTRKFLVTATDSDAVAALLTDDVREFFRANPFWTATGSGKVLVLRYGNPCWVKDMDRHLACAELLASLLVRAFEAPQAR